MIRLISMCCILIGGCLAFSVGFADETFFKLDMDEIEYPDDEPHSQQEVELGKKLFFDNRLSVNQKQSCATCHNPDLGFGDGMAKGLGTMGNSLGRNTPHIYNLAWNVSFFWDGRASSLEEQALGPIQAAGEMNMPLDKLVSRLNKVRYYRDKFEEVYGEPQITAENIGRAIAAFERSVIVQDTPYDRYLDGDKTAMGEEAVRGMKLFAGKARCVRCHDGANFTDNSFHNIGLGDEDSGRESVVKDSSLNKAFKTPGLRNVLFTAPYMHDGSIATLEDVIRFYNRGGDEKTGIDREMVALNLSDQEISDLVAFLGALSAPLKIARPEIP